VKYPLIKSLGLDIQSRGRGSYCGVKADDLEKLLSEGLLSQSLVAGWKGDGPVPNGRYDLIEKQAYDKLSEENQELKAALSVIKRRDIDKDEAEFIADQLLKYYRGDK